MDSKEPKLWEQLDEYITGKILHVDSALEAAIAANHAASLPTIDVSPPQGKLLHLLALAAGAKRILEIGTLGGYSTIWMAKALPQDGQLVTLEFSPKHAEVARKNLDHAGLGSKVEIRVGPAADSLENLIAERAVPFDLVFIDADKKNNALYVSRALELSRKGTIIIVDNVVREGEILNSASNDPDVQGTQQMFHLVGTSPRLTATAIQTVGGKGHDGFVLAVVTS